MTVVCIQIGNTDDKLSQLEWSEYCRAIRGICEAHGLVHFSGGSAADAAWQNYCVCVETSNADALRESVIKRRATHRQESVAWLQGETELV
jgi:hypothetical protein